MVKIFKISALCMGVLLAFSCKTAKPGNAGKLSSSDPKEIISVLNNNTFDFNYLSLKSKTSFTSPDLQETFTMNIRMKRDSVMWISVQAILGIEVARIYINQDSLYVLQKFPKTSVTRKSINEISSIAGVSVTLRQIQDVFVGNSLTATEPFIVATQNDSLVIEKKFNDFMLREIIHPALPRVSRSGLKSLTENATSDIIYSGYYLQGTKMLPKKVNIFVHSKELDANCELNYYDVSTEPVTSFPFRIPEGY